MDYWVRWENKILQKLYFVSYILVLGSLNGAKRTIKLPDGGQKYKIFNFDLSFAQNLALLHLFEPSYPIYALQSTVFGIVSFAQPFFQSIYGFTVFQMAHWPKN